MAAVDIARPLNVITPTVDGDVLAVLAGASAWFTGRQVHQIVGRHSERGVRNALHRLSGQGIVLQERVGSAGRYALNRSHLAAAHIEALAGLRAELLRRIISQLDSWAAPPEFATLFGSAARGDMRADSDIDLCIVRPDSVDADDERWVGELGQLSDDVAGWTGNDARILELSASEVRAGLQANEPVLSEIESEGVVLHGASNYMKRKPPKRRTGKKP
jgi:predicted nucleotidyltransferase